MHRGIVAEVELVHGEEHRALGAAELFGDGLIDRMHSLFAVHQKEDEVRLRQGELHLAADRLVHHLVGVGYQSAGVHQPEVAPAPLGITEMPVPGGAGVLRDDGVTASENPVEQGGLAHVGPAHDGDGGLAHAATA